MNLELNDVQAIRGDGMPEAQIPIKNSGQTPAHNVISIGGFAIATTVSVVAAARLLTAEDKAALASGAILSMYMEKFGTEMLLGENSGPNTAT